MKIGDLVCRSTGPHAFIPGIVVDRQSIKYPPNVLGDCAHSLDEDYVEENYYIAWSNDTLSWEILEELIFFGDRPIRL